MSIDFLFSSVCRYILNITNIFSTILHISYSKDNQFPVTVSYATPNQKMKKYYIYIDFRKNLPRPATSLNSFPHINMIAISTHTTIYTKFPVTLEFVSFLIVYLILTYNLKLSFQFCAG